jgi:galactokinase
LQNQEYAYTIDRDYFRSVANLLKREGIKLEKGCECIVNGTIPINSGTSSSSALNVAWCKFLLELNQESNPDIEKDIVQIARLAYLAEVEEFGEPGGMMDHYATAVGGILYQEFGDKVTLSHLKNPLGTFVLGDSMQPKETTKILHRVKIGVLEALKKIKEENPLFNLEESQLSTVNLYKHLLTDSQIEVLEGALINREITIESEKYFQQKSFDHRQFGRLISEHQEILSKKLKISTDKIDRMLKKSIEAGAFGGKINGSGGGGCMFVYAPEDPEKVAKAIEAAGGKPYIINVDQGLQVSKL